MQGPAAERKKKKSRESEEACFSSKFPCIQYYRMTTLLHALKVMMQPPSPLPKPVHLLAPPLFLSFLSVMMNAYMGVLPHPVD
jgi:hypothetical protein